MINTMNTMVVTNLRLMSDDLVYIKEVADGVGMSFNKYMTWAAKTIAPKILMGVKDEKMSIANSISTWDLPKLARKVKSKPMGMSSDDEAVYY